MFKVSPSYLELSRAWGVFCYSHAPSTPYIGLPSRAKANGCIAIASLQKLIYWGWEELAGRASCHARSADVQCCAQTSIQEDFRSSGWFRRGFDVSERPIPRIIYIYIDIYIYYYKECKVTQNMKAPSIQGIFAMKGYTALWASLNYADQAAEPTAGADSWSGLNLVAERALGFRGSGNPKHETLHPKS